MSDDGSRDEQMPERIGDAEPKETRFTEMHRRGFIRKSAEVAAMSLFGLMGFDAVADKVLERMSEWQWVGDTARSVARHLEDSGVIGVAYADFEPGCGTECPSKPYTCEGVELYTCPKPGFLCQRDREFYCPVKFTCEEVGHFWCEWGESFSCAVQEPPFDCETTFACPPWVAGAAWFDCDMTGETPEFACSYPAPFTCGAQDGVGYLCPGVGKFAILDCPADHSCQPGTEYAMCVKPDGAQFLCPTGFRCTDAATIVYDCGVPGTHGGFQCGGGPGAEFSCDSTTIYDFSCRHEFTCGLAEAQSFNCESNHEFMCWPDVHLGFICSHSFQCTAGGNRCGLGMTGAYSYPPPGDFFCDQGGDVGFSCQEQTAFLCKAADDFRCGYMAPFQCIAPFTGCQPPPGGKGVFACDTSAKHPFVCQPDGGHVFVCQEPAPFADQGFEPVT